MRLKYATPKGKASDLRSTTLETWANEHMENTSSPDLVVVECKYRTYLHSILMAPQKILKILTMDQQPMPPSNFQNFPALTGCQNSSNQYEHISYSLVYSETSCGATLTN
ncbi:hypothetical protein EMPG_13262 [Blastomyces silverae]|uniref:Uncharacterized protein n=1 Tax=Blastomyces silverae TaxID=2060906 RepID=A0A0H1BJM7_9EURO|nr:hypothetical protein EMPG_13262 [Blastomyces silverae]